MTGRKYYGKIYYETFFDLKKKILWKISKLGGKWWKFLSVVMKIFWAKRLLKKSQRMVKMDVWWCSLWLKISPKTDNITESHFFLFKM